MASESMCITFALETLHTFAGFCPEPGEWGRQLASLPLSAECYAVRTSGSICRGDFVAPTYKCLEVAWPEHGQSADGCYAFSGA